MVAANDRDDGGSGLLGLLDGDVGAVFRGDVPEGPLAVHQGGGGRLLDDLGAGLRIQLPAVDHPQVGWNADDAVRVVASEVGTDERFAHLGGEVGVEHRRR